NRLEDRPDVVSHDARTLGRRMDAVALIERLAAGDPIEKERHERDVILLCERGIHLMKLHDVCAAEIRRRLHAGQYDGDSTGLRALNDLPQVPLQFLRRESAQGVVAANATTSTRTSPSSAQ